jgi:hypothetical protein
MSNTYHCVFNAKGDSVFTHQSLEKAQAVVDQIAGAYIVLHDLVDGVLTERA